MEKQLEDLKAIREMMEKSSKFLSLSGLSGVLSGITAVLGAAIAYFYILGQSRAVAVPLLIMDALLILVISIGFGILFSARKAKKHKMKLVNSVTMKIAYNLSIPLATGGILSLIMIYRDQIELVAAITLIFYGIGLINVSKYTHDEIHFLGLTEIVLGICAALFLYHGIVFWTLGFGVCHIVYGSIMYKKYDFKK